MDLLDNGQIQEAQGQYLKFLDDKDDKEHYQQVKTMIEKKSQRLIINMGDLRRDFPERATKLMSNAFNEIVAFERALKEYVTQVDPVYGKQTDEFFVGFEGSFGKKHVTPRTLTSRDLNSTVCVEGIITKASLVRPKLVQSVHYCPGSKKTLSRNYADLTSISAQGPTGSAYPTQDPETGEALETEFGLSTYRDHQTLTIQEMPEKAPTGQLPRSVDIVMDNDLVDSCKPGDRVQIIGTYRCLPGKKQGHTTGIFRTSIIANNVQHLQKDQAPSFFENDIPMIRKFGKGKDPFSTIAASMAPSIHGHGYTKKALLALLLGGTEKNLPNGTRLRGDINVMMIGDPSTAKSQLLRYVLKTAPRAINTTGRGTTGVGLTAAVTTDEETGEKRLEAGAMVLADRGVVCIDEFDKMNDQDRTSIHEAMEQGRVTIAKAGIHAKLNARCSVLAAANPVFGRYNQYKTPMENIAMPDSLLSRFDLLFVILDTSEPELDREIADRVIRNHRYRDPSQQDGEPIHIDNEADRLTTLNDDEDENETQTKMYEDHNEFLHGKKRRGKSNQIISSKFIKKYLYVAKMQSPKLTKEAADAISEEYARLRSVADVTEGSAKTIPITARTLETLIRISTAHAKCRLSKKIEARDAEAAIELIQYAYFAKVVKKPGRRKKKGDMSEDESGEGSASSADEDPVDQDEDSQADLNASMQEMNVQQQMDSQEEDQPSTSRRRKKRGRTSESDKAPKKKARAEDVDALIEETSQSDQTRMDQAKIIDVPQPKKDQFKAKLNEIFMSEHVQQLSFDDVVTKVNAGLLPSETFNDNEVKSCLNEMEAQNIVMCADDVVFLI